MLTVYLAFTLNIDCGGADYWSTIASLRSNVLLRYATSQLTYYLLMHYRHHWLPGQ